MMLNVFKKAMVSLALLGLSTAAFANTYSFNQPKGFSIQTINESANFVLSGAAFSNSATVLNIKNAAGDVVLSLNKDLSTNLFSLGSTSFIAGTYSLSFNSSLMDARGRFVSAFGSITGQPAIGASPVPEPESPAMMLMGLGVLGLIIRRKFA